VATSFFLVVSSLAVNVLPARDRSLVSVEFSSQSGPAAANVSGGTWSGLNRCAELHGKVYHSHNGSAYFSDRASDIATGRMYLRRDSHTHKGNLLAYEYGGAMDRMRTHDGHFGDLPRAEFSQE
jgi:hypothetical protein